VAVFSFSGAEVVLVVVSCSSRGGRGSWQQGCCLQQGRSLSFLQSSQQVSESLKRTV
jgi:hypothetical protein